MSDIVRAIETYGPLASFPWHTQQQFALASATNVVVVLGGNQAQPVDEPVWTPSGWRAIGDLRPGDPVASGMGDFTRVVAVHPQGSRPVFRLTFDDGAWTRCCEDHLWVVQDRARRFRKKSRDYGTWTVMSLGEIRNRWGDAPRPVQRVAVPAGARAEGVTEDLPVHPYLLGLLLGDGCLGTNSVSLSTADPEIVAAVEALTPRTVSLRQPPSSRYDYRIRTDRNKPNPVLEGIRALGLGGCGSHDKFIPESYMTACADDRLALFQGLMDTDGTVSKAGHVTYSTVSPRLAEGVVELARSLGAKCHARVRHTHYTHNGERRNGKLSWRIRVRMPAYAYADAFRLKRKRDRCFAAVSTCDERVLHIVEAAGTEECVCIEVEHPTKTYMTRDFIVTHNSGKTTSGAGAVSRLVRREGPVYRRLRNPDGRRLKIWVSPQTFEKYKSNWERRLHDEVFAGMDATHSVKVEYKQSPSPVFEWEDENGGGELWGKSQDQGFLAFESDKVDMVVFDEEPKDPRLYTSAVQRLATTNGIVVLTFTPLLGISWTHGRFYQPAVKDEYQVADRVWRRGNEITVIEMGMADNPESVAGGGVARIKNDPGMTEAEKATRLYGKYGYAEGLIFPEFATLTNDSDGPYMLDGLPDGRPYSWYLLADPNKRHGGLLCAIDHEGNRYYVAEHYMESEPDRIHAAAYKSMMGRHKLHPSNVSVHADPGGAGAQAIVNLSDSGVFAQPVPKDAGSVKASIELIRRAAWIDPAHRHPVTGEKGAPHCYFLRSLRSTWKNGGVEYNESRLLWELRQYRQKDNAPPDTPIKELDDVVDPMRYLELVRPFTPAYVDTSEQEAREALDSLSRKASDEFDDLVKKHGQKQTTGGFW